MTRRRNASTTSEKTPKKTTSVKFTNVKIVSETRMNEYKSGVYVMGNNMTPGVYKIGRVHREKGTLRNRINEQESAQWVLPDSLHCLIFIPIENDSKLEKALHHDPGETGLAKFRCSKQRELFKMPLKDIFDKIVNYATLLECQVLVSDDKNVKSELCLHNSKNKSIEGIGRNQVNIE